MERQKSLFHIRNAIFCQTPVMETVNILNLKLRKPLIPREKEINRNINSRSAKLRYGIRTDTSFLYSKEFKKNFETYLKLEETRL